MEIVNLGFPQPGFGTYTGAGGTLNFDVQVTGLVAAGGAATLYGTWAANGGTGTYGSATGLGTFSIVYYDEATSAMDASYTTFRGNIEAVPEPATMVALGLGALSLLRRRTKR